MIELNGIYKLKKIQGFKNHDPSDFKVVKFCELDSVICKKLNGDDAGEMYYFRKDFLIDPEHPEDNISDIRIIELN